MDPYLRRGLRFFAVVVCFGGSLFGGSTAPARQDDGGMPSKETIAKLLAEQPVSMATWPDWRGRYLRWYFDRSGATDDMDASLASFVAEHLTPDGDAVAAPLEADPVAWLLLSHRLLESPGRRDRTDMFRGIEPAARRAVELGADLGPAHAKLAFVLALEAMFDGANAAPGIRERRLDEADEAIARAVELSPEYRPAATQGIVALGRRRFPAAQRLLAQAVQDHPRNEMLAMFCLQATLGDRTTTGPRSATSAPLVARFPENGIVLSMHAACLAHDGSFPAAAAAIRKARTMGTAPERLIGDEAVRAIERLARPSPAMQFLRVMTIFAAAYALIIIAMAAGGAALSMLTPRVPPAIQPGVTVGGIAISGQESWVARSYLLSLVAGIVLFYVSIPFVAAGIVAATAAGVFLILQLPRIPVKLLVFVPAVGLAMAWAVLRSIFASHGRATFGLRQTDSDCPRLFAAIRDVADRTETHPLEEVYLVPGAEIGVHQTGRGPFGIFGVKRRVLALGMATLSALTVSELKSILAHEYAHFSNRDTFYSRFIHQVTLSIATALDGMGAAGGMFTFINPFFWFLWLFHRAYGLLACGFSRSREFLADRMAASLYGRNTFESALTKVAVEGTLFERIIYPTIGNLLSSGQALENMYDAFRRIDGQRLTAADREGVRRSLLTAKSAWFATHPTLAERFRAVQSCAEITAAEPGPALDLFDDVADLEGRLTRCLTAHARRAAAS